MKTARNLILFVIAATAAFLYICNAIPQIKSEPVAATAAIGTSADALVASGQRVFTSDRAQCLTCHSLGEDPKARCPNQEGLGERAATRKPGVSAAEYLVESVYNPNAYVVAGYPRNQMTPVHTPPIALSHDEILAALAFLNTLGGKTDADFVEQLRKAQEPWRAGLLKPEQAAERRTLPIFSGEPRRGWDLFQKQGCLQCHRVGTEGRDVGPDLSAIGASQGPEYLLESFLDPSAVIVKGYKNTIVVWKEESRIAERGQVVSWIPSKDRPRRLRLSVVEGGESRETEMDLAQVAQVGDTTLGVKIAGQARFFCGEYVDGDRKTGVTLLLLENGRWEERRFPPEVIQFVNFPVSPMPGNYGELTSPREVYDLVAYLREQKGKK